MARRIALVVSLLLGLSGLSWAGQLEDQQAEIQDILQLVTQGVSDDVIIKHIEARGFVFDLTADEILDLRDRGVSEDVIAVMLETAIDDQPSQRERERVYVREEPSDVNVYLGAGYFSPWYYYPYAWSYYYDPFPVHYSAYYYPFAFSFSWGWYGSCSYWYPSYWRGYGWCDPYYWDYAYCRPGCWVPAPSDYGSRWESGRGMASDRNAPANRARAGESVDRVRDGQTVARREGQPVNRVREGAPAAAGRAAESVSRVRSGQSAERVRTPASARGSEPVVGSRSASSPREPARTPRVTRSVSRDRVHTRTTAPASSRTVTRSSSQATRRSERSVAPRTTAPSRAPASVRSPSSSLRAPSSGLRVPQFGSVARPQAAPAPRMGGRGSAPAAAPRGGGGGGRLR